MARSIEISSERAEALGALAPGLRERNLAAALERYAALLVVVVALLGFGLRVGGLGAVGFAEDEINKLDAVRAYERGDITPNAEHPMLMKSLIFASMAAARWWNGVADAPRSRVSDEAALRLPNALFGALTVLPLFLLTAALFDRRAGLVAASLWAFGVNAITFNRVGKEDTLLVFFMLLAFYFYVRAKQTSGFRAGRKRLSYFLSAASFGLMFASKYFPQFFGLNMLYHHLVRLREREPGEPRGKTPAFFYVVVAATFLLVNPALFLPQTWAYLSVYSSEKLLTHTGYLIGDTLYNNTPSGTPFWGTPVYFYLLYMLVKVPLTTLLALVVGLFVVARRWREPGPLFVLLMFVLWVVPYSLAGAKWLRYALSLMPFVYMICAVGVVWMVRAAARALRARARLPHAATLAGVAALVFVVAPAWVAFEQMPHYALYTNALAGRERAGYFFPHDEFYDDGLREAVEYVARHAPPGATVAHEAPGVVRHYLEKFGRTDLRSRVVSDPQFNPLEERGPAYVILQRGRTYFENREEFEAVRRAGVEGGAGTFVKDHEVFVRGVSAAEVYANAPATPRV